MLFKEKAVLGLGHQATLGLWNKKKGGGAIYLRGCWIADLGIHLRLPLTLQIFKQSSWPFSD